jgi:hypothetical protein
VFFFTNTFLDAQPPVLQIEPKNVNALRISGGVLQKENFFAFDGNTGMIEFNSDYQPKGNFSISMEIKPGADFRPQTLLLKGEICPDGNGDFKGNTFALSLTSENKLSGIIYYGGEKVSRTFLSFLSTEAISHDTWQLVTFIYDSELIAWNVFVDDERIAIKNSFQGSQELINLIAPSKNATWKVGASESYCGYNHRFEDYFRGRIKFIRIYDFKITPDQIGIMANSELYTKSILLTISGLATLVVGLLILRNARQRFFRKNIVMRRLLD